MSVYFAQAGSYTKVGYSKDPISRGESITRLGTRPDDLPKGTKARLLGWIPGDRHREAAMHAQFAAHRVAGEWYVLEEAKLRDLIWSDPCGVDLQRMAAQAVFVMLANPGTTRGDLEAAEIRVEAVPLGALPFLGGAA